MDTKEKISLDKVVRQLAALTDRINKSYNIDKRRLADIISEKELKSKLDICDKTAYNWRKRGLNFYKKNSKIFYIEKDVIDYLTSMPYYYQKFTN